MEFTAKWTRANRENERHLLCKSKSNNAEKEETKKIFNKIRNKPKKSKIKKIRKDLYEKEKGLENENENEREKKQHAKEFKKIKIFLEGLKKYFEKVYYKPIKTKGAFNNNYIEYESRGDKEKN